MAKEKEIHKGISKGDEKSIGIKHTCRIYIGEIDGKKDHSWNP